MSLTTTPSSTSSAVQHSSWPMTVASSIMTSSWTPSVLAAVTLAFKNGIETLARQQIAADPAIVNLYGTKARKTTDDNKRKIQTQIDALTITKRTALATSGSILGCLITFIDKYFNGKIYHAIVAASQLYPLYNNLQEPLLDILSIASDTAKDTSSFINEELIPGAESFVNSTEHTKAIADLHPLKAGAAAIFGSAAGATGIIPPDLALPGAIYSGSQGPTQTISAGTFLASSALSRALGFGGLSGSLSRARNGAIATAIVAGTVGLYAGAASNVALAASSAGMASLYLFQSSKLLKWTVYTTLTTASLLAQYTTWVPAQKLVSSFTALIPIPYVEKIKQLAELALSSIWIGTVYKFAEDPSRTTAILTQALPANITEQFRKDPLGTAKTVGSKLSPSIEKLAKEGIQEAAKTSFQFLKKGFWSAYETGTTWLSENGFEMLNELPKFAVRTAATVLNFAAFSAPRLVYQAWQSLDITAKTYLFAYFGFLSFLAFKPKVPSDIEFTSASLIPRTIRKISSGTKKGVQKGIGKLEPHTRFAKRINRYLFPKKPQPIFNEKLEKEIKSVVSSIEKTRSHDGFLENLLLEGPPGTGKTMIGKKIAEESGCHFIKMTGASLVNLIGSISIEDTKTKSGWKHTRDAKPHVTKLREILAFGHGTLPWYFRLPNAIWSRCIKPIPTVLFIDEIDLFTRHREDLDKLDPNRLDLLYSFLAATGEPSKDLMIIGTTNRVKNMDEAAVSRFGSVLHIGAPDRKAREKILKEHIDHAFPEEKHPERKDALNEAAIARIAENTEGTTGRDLVQLTWGLRRAKGITDKNLLSEASVDQATHEFLQRKRAVSRDPALQPSWKSALFDFTHFTVPAWKRKWVHVRS